MLGSALGSRIVLGCKVEKNIRRVALVLTERRTPEGGNYGNSLLAASPPGGGGG